MSIVAMVLAYASLAMFVAALFLAKFIGIEMIGVMQAAFLGLMAVTNLPPLLAPLSILVRSTGYDAAFTNQTQTAGIPYPISSLTLEAPLINNINYTLALLLLPFLVALGLFAASKLTKDNIEKQQKLMRWSMLALNDWGFTAVMFLLYHTIVSVILFVVYGGQLSTIMLGISAGEAVVVLGLSIASVVLFKYKPEFYGDYRKAFNADIMSQYHYWLIFGARAIFASLIVMTNPMKFSGLVCIAVPLIGIVYLAVKRPYTLLYNNIRAIVNETILMLVLGIYSCYQVVFDYTNQGTIAIWVLPIAVYALLFGCLLMNSVFMVKYWYDCRNPIAQDAKSPEQKIDSVKQSADEEALYMLEAKRRLTSMVDKKSRFPAHIVKPVVMEQQEIDIDDSPKHDEIITDRAKHIQQSLLNKKLTTIKTKTTTVIKNFYMTEEEAHQVNQDFDQL